MKKRRKHPQQDAVVSATEMTGMQPFLQNATGENPSGAELIPIPFAKVPETPGK